MCWLIFLFFSLHLDNILSKPFAFKFVICIFPKNCPMHFSCNVLENKNHCLCAKTHVLLCALSVFPCSCMLYSDLHV